MWSETQQELTLLKHKGWSVVELVLSELTVTRMGGNRRHGAQELTVQRQRHKRDTQRFSEIVARTLKKIDV